jgi:hypothetical protein
MPRLCYGVENQGQGEHDYSYPLGHVIFFKFLIAEGWVTGLIYDWLVLSVHSVPHLGRHDYLLYLAHLRSECVCTATI